VRTPPPETAGAVAGSPRRFDPFLLPSATSIRFLLNILVAAVASMYVGYWSVPVVPLLGVDATGAAAQAACADQARADADRLSPGALLDGFVGCLAATDRQILLWMLAPGLVWACLTIAVYALYPLLLEKLLRPVRPEDDDGVSAAGRELRDALAGSRKRVALLTTPGTAGGARVFGAFGRYRLAVDTSLLAPGADGGLDERALAVIRHEAAHLRNRDVDITYLTMSSWWGFVLSFAGPLLLYWFAALYSVAVDGSWTILLHSALPGSVLVVSALLLLQTARARVLRTREHYADVRAAQTGRTGEVLHRLFTRPRRPEGRPLSRWWRGRHGYHPSHRSRAEVLDDPRRLTAVSGADLLIAGIALGAAYLHLSAVGGMAGGSQGIVSAAALVGLPVGALVTAIVWNAVHAGRRDPSRSRRAAALLTGGVLVGLLPPVQPGTWWVALLASNPLSGAVSILVLWWVCLLFLRWSALCAEAWLAATTRKRTVCFAGMSCGALVFGFGFGIWSYLHGVLGAEAAGGWVGLLGAPVTVLMADWRFPAAVGCATVFAFTGLARGAGTHRIARRPLVPVMAGCALAAVYAALLLGAAVAALGGGLLPLVLILFVVASAAAATSVALGAWAHGLRGAGPCAAAVAALMLLALEPLVYATVFDGTVCLLTEASPGCLGSTARAVLAGYAEPIFVRTGLPVLLLLCGTGAVAGSWLRSKGKARGRAPAEPGRGGLGLGRGRRTAVALAAAAAAITLGSVTAAVLRAEAPGIGAELRPQLSSQVEPAALSRDGTCAQTATAVDLRPGGDLLLSSGAQAGVVALASSSDPVLASFGRAALTGSGTSNGQLFDAVRSYCASGRP
jgi:hypothetical protein